MTYPSAGRRLHRPTRVRVGRKAGDRRAAAAKGVDTESARRRQRATEVLALDEAAARYARRLGRDVFRGFQVAALFGLILAYLKVLAAYSNGPQVNVPVLSTGTALGSFGILAGLITALQVAVRSGANEAPTARRQFLAKTASLLMLASVALGTYVGMQFMATAPRAVELVRMFGPILGGIVLAMLAADAAAAAETLGKDKEAKEALREQDINRKRRRCIALARGTTSPRCIGVVRDLLYPSLLTLATVATMSIIPRGGKPLNVALLAVAVAIYIGIAWLVVYLAAVSSRTGQWSIFLLATLAATIAAFSIGWSVVLDAITHSTPDTVSANAGWSLASWLAFNAAAYFTGVNAFRVVGQHKRRGILLEVAARRAAGELRRAGKETKDRSRSLATTMANWAIALCLLFPFGLVLAQAALRQADRAGDEPHIRKRLRIAVAASWATLALLLAALATLAIRAPVIV
ncbi:MAG: hypothetical protein QM695_13485 [Micropruina sp.]